MNMMLTKLQIMAGSLSKDDLSQFFFFFPQENVTSVITEIQNYSGHIPSRNKQKNPTKSLPWFSYGQKDILGKE